MKMKECKIIQDLLPSYIDGLTNSETNLFIEEHIKECENCKKEFENMKEGLKSNTKFENKDINYLRKIRQKMNALILILITIIIIVLVLFIRRYVIISDISKKVNNLNDITNYQAKSISYKDNSIFIDDSHYDNGKIFAQTKYIEELNSYTQIKYFDTNTSEVILINPESNTAIVKNTEPNVSYYIPIDNSYYIFDFNNINFLKKLDYTIKIKNITENVCNNKDCYLIAFKNGNQIWIEKDTGLTIRVSYADDYNGTKKWTTYEYEYNINPEKRVEKPNLKQYNITEK